MRKKADSARQLPLYNRIAVLRTEHGLSRQHVTAALGVNCQTIGYIERGEYNPSFELAFRLSALSRVPIEAIFSREPFKPPSAQVYSTYPDTSS